MPARQRLDLVVGALRELREVEQLVGRARAASAREIRSTARRSRGCRGPRAPCPACPAAARRPGGRGSRARGARGPCPGSRSVPSVTGDMHAIIRIVLVLPAPLGPRKPKLSPGATSKSIASTAVKSPNRLVSPRAWMSGKSGLWGMGRRWYPEPRDASLRRPGLHGWPRDRKETRIPHHLRLAGHTMSIGAIRCLVAAVRHVIPGMDDLVELAPHARGPASPSPTNPNQNGAVIPNWRASSPPIGVPTTIPQHHPHVVDAGHPAEERVGHGPLADRRRRRAPDERVRAEHHERDERHAPAAWSAPAPGGSRSRSAGPRA